MTEAGPPQCRACQEEPGETQGDRALSTKPESGGGGGGVRQGRETPGALLLNVYGDQKKVFPGRRKKWPSLRAGHQQAQMAGALFGGVGRRARSWAEPRFLLLGQGQPQTAGLCRMTLGGTGEHVKLTS